MLTYTLIKFWIKNPQETIVVIGFIAEKITALPKFLSRNVLIEKNGQKFKKNLQRTIKLYQKYGKNFNPKDPNSYKKMRGILSDKEQILYFLVRVHKPEIVVETGVAAGKSTGNILQALNDNGFGKLYSIDLPFQWYIYEDHKLHLDSLPSGEMSGFLVPEKLKKNWQLVLGDTHKKLAVLLKRLGKIDIFFHDSKHVEKTMLFEYQTAWPYIKSGGFLLSDDVGYTKAFNNFCKIKSSKSIAFRDFGIISKL